jgi:hypothetical protein
MECGALFREGGEVVGSSMGGDPFWNCAACLKKDDEERKKSGRYRRNASDDEIREWQIKREKEERKQYLKEFEEEERIKARVWAEARRK